MGGLETILLLMPAHFCARRSRCPRLSANLDNLDPASHIIVALSPVCVFLRDCQTARQVRTNHDRPLRSGEGLTHLMHACSTTGLLGWIDMDLRKVPDW